MARVEFPRDVHGWITMPQITTCLRLWGNDHASREIPNAPLTHIVVEMASASRTPPLPPSPKPLCPTARVTQAPRATGWRWLVPCLYGAVGAAAYVALLIAWYHRQVSLARPLPYTLYDITNAGDAARLLGGSLHAPVRERPY